MYPAGWCRAGNGAASDVGLVEGVSEAAHRTLASGGQGVGGGGKGRAGEIEVLTGGVVGGAGGCTDRRIRLKVEVIVLKELLHAYPFLRKPGGGLGDAGAGQVIAVTGNGDRRQDADDDHHYHDLDQGEASVSFHSVFFLQGRPAWAGTAHRQQLP